VQGNGVEEGLERVVGVDHRALERRGAVVPGGQRFVRRGEPVGLVVDDHVALVVLLVRINGWARIRLRPAHPDNGVDRAGEVPTQPGGGAFGGEDIEGVGVPGEGAAGQVGAPEVGDAGEGRGVGAF